MLARDPWHDCHILISTVKSCTRLTLYFVLAMKMEQLRWRASDFGINNYVI